MLAKKHYKLDAKGDTLHISKLARTHKQEDNMVINATVGALYDDEHRFFEYETVIKGIKAAPTQYPYMTSAGDPEVAYAWLKHMFGDALPKTYEAMLTIGGTGALSLAMDTYLDEGDGLISGVPDWTNYQNLAEHAKLKYITYPLFNASQQFNLEGLKQQIVAHQDKKIMILINDPAQNPTGYSMDEKTWKDVFDVIHSYNKERNIVLLIDTAYIDFADDRSIAFRILKTYQNPVMTLIAGSASKSFSLYGARLGILAAFGNEIELKSFKEASLYAARGTYSLPSNFGINVLKYVFNHQEPYQKERMQAKDMLQLRRDAFIAILKEKNIEYYPQSHGFFVTLVTNDPFPLYETFRLKKIYTIPVHQGLRIALSSLSLEDIAWMKTRL